MTFRILVADELSPEGIEILERAGDVEVRTGMDEATLRDTLPGFHALVVRSATKVTAGSLEKARDLSVIGRAGIGIDNIDVAAATERGIVVMNSPDATAVTTGEHAIALMASMSRHVPAADASMKAGRWDKKVYVGSEMRRKTLGVLGLGRIGTVVADRGVGLRMNVIAHDPFVTESPLVGVQLVTFEELLAKSDYLSIHVPRSEKTLGLIGAEAMSKMKQGARIINCARGGIVDEDALCDALESGHLAGGALDVFDSEPLPEDSRLRRTEGLVLTPHLGASTAEAQLNVAISVAEQVRDYLIRGVIGSAVNVPSLSSDEAGALDPYIQLGEKIGSLYAQLAGRAPSSVQIELHGEVAGVDGRPVSAAVLKGLLERVSEPPVNTINAPLLAAERGIQVTDLRDSKPIGFANSIRVRFQSAEGENVIDGAVFGADVIRIVRCDDFHFEVAPEGDVLVLNNNDVPGVVGNVGTFLANEKINIAGLALGRVRGTAVSFVHVDSAVTEDQLAKLRELPDITGAHMVRFG